VTTAELAEHLKCSTKTVTRMVERGEIRAVPIGERLVRFDVHEVDRMLSAKVAD
jgi:excisionase family DNA binding protein